MLNEIFLTVNLSAMGTGLVLGIVFLASVIRCLATGRGRGDAEYAAGLLRRFLEDVIVPVGIVTNLVLGIGLAFLAVGGCGFSCAIREMLMYAKLYGCAFAAFSLLAAVSLPFAVMFDRKAPEEMPALA